MASDGKGNNFLYLRFSHDYRAIFTSLVVEQIAKYPKNEYGKGNHITQEGF